MEFAKIDKFLFHSLDLCSIDSFSITISGIDNVIGENDVIDFSKSFQNEVIEEIYENLSTIQPGTVQLYFNLLFKKIEDYYANKDWKYYPHFDIEKRKHLLYQFSELLYEYPENEELLQIVNDKGGFEKYLTKENDNKRLIIVERLKKEIVEIRDDYFRNERKQLPERTHSNFNLSLKTTDFTVLNKFNGHVIQIFRNENEIRNKTENEITTIIYDSYKNLESNVNSLFKFSTVLMEERTNFSLSIPGNEQREYFLNFYNGIISQRVKDIEEHIWEIIEFIVKDTYQKNPNATVTRDSFEKECEWANFLLSAFAKDYLTKENIETDNESLPETIQTSNQKLKWTGTPSQFGFIIDLLIQGGYLEKPTSSFAKDANFYLQFFDIETTNSTLAKELSEGTNSLATKNRKKITIPNKDKLG
jgi:hypothetical protein